MYLNLIQLAESFGVPESVVEEWVRKEDLPHTLDRGRLLFDRQQVADWAAARGLAKQVGFLMKATPVLTAGLEISTLLRRGGIWRDVSPAEAGAVFAKVVGTLPAVAPALVQILVQRLVQPGAVNIAPVGGGWALPHFAARLALGRESGTAALLLLREPWALEDPPPDGIPVRHLIFFVAPSARAHLDLLARLGRVLAGGTLQASLQRGAPDDELLDLFAAADAGSGDQDS